MRLKSADYGSKKFLLAHYALNILESQGYRSPSQRQINSVECFLKNAISCYERGITLVRSSNIQQRQLHMLLIEDQFFYTLTHTIIFRNLGFEVSHASSNFDAMTHSFLNYDVIVISDHPPNLNALLVARHIGQLKLKITPILIAIMNKSDMTDENLTLFVKHGFQKILPRLIVLDQLVDTFKNFGFNLKN